MKIDEIKDQLFRRILESEIGPEITDMLVPNGKPYSFETELWDYKRKAPQLPEKPNDDDRNIFDQEVHELIKDIVSFHNSYGGYLIFGIEDTGAERLCGCDAEIDCGDISQRILARSGSQIELYTDNIEIECNSGKIQLLAMLIPRRSTNAPPVKFKKASPEFNGKRAYQKDTVYVRVGDKCRPASNSAEDWKFLFSDRKLNTAKPEKADSIASNLPARDPDLIKFVGRESELSNLRDWMFDQRSPIRLLTGIGGLGKTSVAYQFCEELIDSGAGSFDFVAWVTAKKSTYAALQGKMVKTTRHDFSNTTELLESLITSIAGESSIVEEMDQSDLVDVLVDALVYRPSFIVVDDLDSLAPDVQRECATVLQEVAVRTVARDHPLSRILLTSRLDQGLSPTNVIKLEGLPFEPFKEHLHNLSRQFKLDKFVPRVEKEIHRSSSGSPLFASAIVRLVYLGENIRDVCASWEKSDGEEVRDFAFKRELERLSGAAASILLAVVYLGEVSIAELEEALEMPKRKVLDHIGELQSFHLVSNSKNRYGEPAFSSSKELIASAGILRRHLGLRAQSVEKQCAKIRQNQGDQTRKIGIELSKIVTFWSEGQNEEALILAKELSNRNQKSGDVWCALAGAFLKIRPANYGAADDAVMRAVDLNCLRPELFDYFVLAKKGIEDWQGLRSFVEKKFFKSFKKDTALDAYMVATSKLVGFATDRGDYKVAARYSFEGAERIASKIAGSALDPAFFKSLVLRQNSFASDAIRFSRRHNPRPGDQLFVAELAFKLYDLNIYRRDVIEAICVSLKTWAEDVEKRPFVDETAIDILSRFIKRLSRIHTTASRRGDKAERDIELISDTVRDLEFIGARLRSL
ncbi:RNA-binding domain-containing protein [Thioclava sp.]|uniref:RNA-binding domain-containing protein n=1 Tax=Thioclava sp. TaxID=1933450 RepID=UPI003AA9C993